MNTNILVVGLLALVVAGGSVWYVVSNNNELEEINGGLENIEFIDNDTTEDASMSGTGSFARFLGLEVAVRCEFLSTIDGNTSSGIFYTDGERFRVDAVSMTPSGTYNSNMINDGEFQYAWGGGAEGEMAIKMPIMETEIEAEQNGAPSETMFDIEEDVAYDCQSWTVDESVFIPPTDRQFMDMTALMSGELSGLPVGFTAQGSY